jgi:hypothetical protein
MRLGRGTRFTCDPRRQLHAPGRRLQNFHVLLIQFLGVVEADKFNEDKSGPKKINALSSDRNLRREPDFSGASLTPLSGSFPGPLPSFSRTMDRPWPPRTRKRRRRRSRRRPAANQEPCERLVSDCPSSATALTYNNGLVLAGGVFRDDPGQCVGPGITGNNL